MDLKNTLIIDIKGKRPGTNFLAIDVHKETGNFWVLAILALPKFSL